MKTNKVIKRRMFEAIMKVGGVVTFERSFPGPWPVKVIRAVAFTEQFDVDADEQQFELWNKYVDKVRKAIGSDYNEWVRDHKGNMIGIMAFDDTHQCEIKMKHFDRWWQLYMAVKLSIKAEK